MFYVGLLHHELLSVPDVDALRQRLAVDALTLEVVYCVVGIVVFVYVDRADTSCCAWQFYVYTDVGSSSVVSPVQIILELYAL